MLNRLLITVMLILFTASIIVKAEDEAAKKETTIGELKDRVDGIDDNVTGLLNDVAGLKKLKISGYMQVNFEKTENAKGLLTDPYDSKENVLSRFRIRRSRLKFTYDAGLTQFVLQGDFSNAANSAGSGKGAFTIKDAYVAFTEPWMKWFSLQTGIFNRPNYEVEYSSSQRESMERSAVILKLYPDERDLGAMITLKPDDLFKLQFAGFNNTYLGDLAQPSGPNFRNEPLYFMTRVTKSLMFKDLGLGIDLGAHARFGNAVEKTPYLAEGATVYQSKFKMYSTDTTALKSLKTGTVGAQVARNWFGVEAQVYFDFLGGTKLMGEFITGTDVNDFASDTISIESRKISTSFKSYDTATKLVTTKFDTTFSYDKSNQIVRKRNFSGFYLMLVQNINSEWGFAVKYDAFTPNKVVAPDNAFSEKDLKVYTIGFGIHNYSFSNIRISLWYDMNHQQTSNNIVGKNTDGTNKLLYPVDLPKNLLTVRFQYKF
ncbi:MAG: hypothetical protein NT007_01485 [Candidatus Kapabacteria bacterium]|nr:hypothetical protein [Candidatus Kapabacteria bacterium]